MKQGTVEKITNGGWGLVRSDEGVVFLNYVIPGEEIRYRIKDRAKGILWGETLDVITRSPHRVEAPCPYFGRCGGCVFQHMAFSYQESVKQGILRDDLNRIGGLDPEIPALVSSPPFHYRTRARLKGREDGKAGFIRKGTHTVLPIDRCLLFPPEINDFIMQWNRLPVTLFFHEMDVLWNAFEKKLYVHLSRPPGKAEETLSALFPGVTFSWKGNEDAAVSRLRIKEWEYLVSPAVFFQVNPHQWENMLDLVAAYLEPCETIMDLYSGVGFFVPLLKRYAENVVGVESGSFSVSLARRAFKDDGISFFKTAAEKFRFPEADILVVDPPRSGLSKPVLRQVLKNRYQKIIYISCSSASFSRDLKILRENGWELLDLKPLDLFPQTAHLETIAAFSC